MWCLYSIIPLVILVILYLNFWFYLHFAIYIIKASILTFFSNKEGANRCYSSAYTALGDGQKNPQKSISYYDRAIDFDPYNEHVFFMKGESLIELGKYNEAVECYDKILKLNPKADYVWQLKGEALFELKKYEEALTCYDKLLEFDDYFVFSMKADVFCEMGRYNEALDFYDKSIEEGEIPEIALLGKGNTFYLMGRYEDAFKCFDEVIDSNQNYGDAWFKKGLMLKKLGKNEEAMTSYNEALKCYEKNINDFPENKKFKNSKDEVLDSISELD